MATFTKEQLLALGPEFLAEDVTYKLINSSVAFLVVQTVVFVMYMSSRMIHGTGNGWTTWLLVPASYICVLALSVSGILSAIVGGQGRHIAYWLLTDPHKMRKYLQIQTSVEYIYLAAVILPKIVILALYLRVFTDRRARVATWCFIVVLALYFFSGLIIGFTICKPISFKWNKSIPDGKCGDEIGVYRYISIPNLLTDVAILLLPLPTLWTLQINRTKKVGVFLTFITGGLGIVVAIVRMVQFFKIDLFSDPTYLGITTMTLTIAEPTAYFICACLPGLRPLVVLVARKIGLSALVETTFQTMRSTNAGTKQRYASNKKTTLNDANGTYRSHISSSNESEERVGFVRLENLKSDRSHSDAV